MVYVRDGWFSVTRSQNNTVWANRFVQFGFYWIKLGPRFRNGPNIADPEGIATKLFDVWPPHRIGGRFQRGTDNLYVILWYRDNHESGYVHGVKLMLWIPRVLGRHHQAIT